MSVILYTTHCPKCSVLERKLNAKDISYAECTNVDIMQNKGIESVPWLEVDGKMMDFKEANEWINHVEVV